VGNKHTYVLSRRAREGEKRETTKDVSNNRSTLRNVVGGEFVTDEKKLQFNQDGPGSQRPCKRNKEATEGGLNFKKKREKDVCEGGKPVRLLGLKQV